MTAYDVIISENVQALIHDVNIRLKDGWELVGGISISISESDDFTYRHYAQALMKKLN